MFPDLRAAIKASSLTHEQIAFRAGVSVSWVNKIAQGRIRSPGIETYQRVASVLNAAPRKEAA